MVGVFSLFKRALLEHSRSPSLIVARAALAITLVVCLLIFGMPRRLVGAAGHAFFNAVVWVNAVFITLGGCTYFASAISEEKEDGTLQLLRMTRISALALLIGKGGARLMDGLLLLAVQLPFTMIGITLGGIAFEQVAAAYLALGAYLVMLCGLGLLAGVLASRPAKATIISVVAIWVILYGGGLAASVFAHASTAAWQSLDVFSRLETIMQTGFNGVLFSTQVQWSFGVGAIAFAASWLLFDRFCADEVPRREGIFGWPFRRAKDFERAPIVGLFLWKDFHHIHGGYSRKLWKRALYAAIFIWLGLESLRGTTTSGDFALWGTKVMGLGLVALAVEMTLAGARAFRVEQRERTLGALLMLPNCNPSLLYNLKMDPFQFSLGPACMFALSGGLLFLVESIVSEVSGMFYTVIMVAIVGVVVATPVIWTQGLFLQRLAMYLSLRVRGGAAALALVIWSFGNALLLLILVLFLWELRGGEVVLYVVFSTFTAGFLAARLKVKSLLLIEKAAEEE